MRCGLRVTDLLCSFPAEAKRSRRRGRLKKKEKSISKIHFYLPFSLFFGKNN